MHRLAIIYLNVAFYFLFLVFSAAGIPLFALLVLPVRLFSSPRKAQRMLRRAIRWYGAVIIHVIAFPWIRIQYRDLEEGNKAEPSIVICNHRSASDAFLMACLPYEELVQVVNIWPFRIPLLGIIARGAGYLSVREMPFEEFLRRATLLLKQGVPIIAFPEGTRSGNKEVGQFHGAVFRVALKLRCPITPLCITGNENAPPRDSFLLRPGKIRIHKLPAVQWQDYKGLNPFTLKNRVREIVAAELKLMEQS